MADIRKPTADIARQELTALAAMVATLRGITTNRGRGEYLLEIMPKWAFLPNYLRACYDPRYNYGIDPMLAMANFAARGGTEPAYPHTLQLLKKFKDEVLLGEEACQAWVDHINVLGPELRAVANYLLGKDLQCGLTFELVNKVFKRLGLKEMEPLLVPDPEALAVRNLCLHITSAGTTPVGHATAYLSLDGQRVANLSFLLTEPGLAALRVLRAAGILFDVPAYIKWE